MLTVDGVYAQPGIGLSGASSTDTSHGLFFGGKSIKNDCTSAWLFKK